MTLRSHARQSRAHNYCMSMFLDGLAARERTLIVDNTHTQLWEYFNYIKAAQLVSYRVMVVELRCQREDLALLAERNQHGVNLDKARAMWERWEPDPYAVVLAPWVPHRGADAHAPEASCGAEAEACERPRGRHTRFGESGGDDGDRGGARAARTASNGGGEADGWDRGRAGRAEDEGRHDGESVRSRDRSRTPRDRCAQ